MQAPSAADPMQVLHVVLANVADAPVLAVPVPPPSAVLADGPGAARLQLAVPASAAVAAAGRQPVASAPSSPVALRGLSVAVIQPLRPPAMEILPARLTIVRRPMVQAATVGTGCPGIPVPASWDLAQVFEPTGAVYERRNMSASVIGTPQIHACVAHGMCVCVDFLSKGVLLCLWTSGILLPGGSRYRSSVCPGASHATNTQCASCQELRKLLSSRVMSRNAADFNPSNLSNVTSLVDARSMIAHLESKVAELESEATGNEASLLFRQIQAALTKYPTFKQSPSYQRFQLFLQAADNGTTLCVEGANA